MILAIPPQHQTDPAKLPGQIVNPVFNHDMMDDMMEDAELHRFMNPAPKPERTLGDYLRRKGDNQAGMPVSEGEALCSRIMR